MDNQGYHGKKPPPAQGQTTAIPIQQQTTVLIRPQPVVTVQPVDLDYSFPQGKIPSIIVILVGVANLLYLIAYGASYRLWYPELLAPPFVFHLIAGIIGAVGSFRQQRSSAVAICCIIFGIISTIIAFWRAMQQGVDLRYADFDNSKFRPLSISQAFYVLFEVAALICSIVLIVVPSIAISKTRRSGGVIYHR